MIDGASTDNTMSILKKNQSHSTKLISEPDRGIYDAMNKGINLADGEIIGFLNSDDFYANNEVLSKVSGIFKSNPLLDACYSDLIYVDKLRTSKTIRYFKSCSFIPGLFSKRMVPTSSNIFCEAVNIQKYGNFDLNFKIASDVDLMMRFLEVNKIRSLYIPEVWVKMRMGGITNKSLKNILLQNWEIINSIKKNGLNISFLSFFY